MVFNRTIIYVTSNCHNYYHYSYTNAAQTGDFHPIADGEQTEVASTTTLRRRTSIFIVRTRYDISEILSNVDFVVIVNKINYYSSASSRVSFFDFLKSLCFWKHHPFERRRSSGNTIDSNPGPVNSV